MKRLDNFCFAAAFVIVLWGVLMLCGCDRKLPALKQLVHSSFDTGSKMGYVVRAWGGTTNDLELVVDAYRSNDLARANAVIDRLEREFLASTNLAGGGR